MRFFNFKNFIKILLASFLSWGVFLSLPPNAFAAVEVRNIVVNSVQWPSVGDQISTNFSIYNNTNNTIWLVGARASYTPTGYLDPDSVQNVIGGWLTPQASRPISNFGPVIIVPGPTCISGPVSIEVGVKVFYMVGLLDFETTLFTRGQDVNSIGAEVYGFVKKPDGTSVVGATVSITPADGSGGSTTTNIIGLYKLRHLNCTTPHTLHAEKDGWHGYVYNVSSNNLSAFICNGDTRQIDITIYPPSTPTPIPPTPTPPTGTPPPTPTSPPPSEKWASLSYDCTNYPTQSPALLASWDVGAGANCNAYIQAGETPHQISSDCASGGTRTIRDASYIWNGGTYQLRVGDPSGTTTSSSSVTINCGDPPPPPPPPPGEYPPPYFQIFWEVANITNRESIPNDCGEGSSPNCSGDWGGWRYWPPTCSNRLIKQTTTASPGNEIQARACFRRMGGDRKYNRHANLNFWLNLAEPGYGYVPLGNAGQDWQVRNAFGGWQSIGPRSGNYQYNNATSRVPYTWLGTTGDLDGYIQNCGSPGDGDDYWEYGCVREVRYKFNIKNDSGLANKTVSAKGWLSISPAVNPYSFHMYLTSCNTGNDLNSLGFWNRTPGCCWGQPFYRNDIDGWPGCPIPENDPRYNNCRYGPCLQGANPVNENFVFWSNWIKINVGSPNTISGYVFKDSDKDGVRDANEQCFNSNPSGNISLSRNGVIQQRFTTSSTSACNLNTPSYTFSNLARETYTVAINQPSGWSRTTSLSQSVTVPPSWTNINFGLIDTSLSGRVYDDPTGRCTGITGLGGAAVSVNCPSRSTNTGPDGHYNFTNLNTGLCIIDATKPNYELSGCVRQIIILTAGANTKNLYLRPPGPWFQGKGADMRLDNGFIDPVPAGNYALLDGNGGTPGVIFSGDSSYSFSPGQPSRTRWVAGGLTYPEVFTPVGGLMRTSYAYYDNLIRQNRITPTDLVNTCTNRNPLNCLLPPNLANGVYQAGGVTPIDITLGNNNYTFPQNKDYVILVNGNLTLKGEIHVPIGSTVIFSVSGDIIVDRNVGEALAASTSPNLEGFFSADEDFVVEGNNNCGVGGGGADKRLNIQGVVMVNVKQRQGAFEGSLQNGRDLCSGNLNPSLFISERPDFILNAPEFLKHPNFIWQEVAP